jgi:succinate dehydrogenase / fumarate reductase cytochrome b subunit
VLPLGAFLVLHAAINARALHGDVEFAATTDALHRMPLLPVVEALLVFAPLVAHAGIGLWLVATRTPLSGQGPYPEAVRVAVRVTGVVALAFVVAHLPELRFRGHGARLDGGTLETVLALDLSSTTRGVPWRGLAYMVGSGCAVFHFAAGLWAYFVARTEGRDPVFGRRAAAVAVAVAGAALWTVFAGAVVYHATGARILGDEPDPRPTAPCPVPSAERPGAPPGRGDSGS